jgi:RNA polymerase sigma-70 factor (ECF subfamily)
MLVPWMRTDESLSPLDQAMVRFATGEDGALGEVYDLGAPAVFNFLLKLCRDRSLAEDLTQETFLRIHRARGLYHAGASVLPWAYTIARHLFLDTARSRRTEACASKVPSHRLDGPEAEIREWRAPGPSAEELLADAELAHLLDDALAKLPETQASAFRLLKGDGLSVAEAAAVMGTTKGAVKLRAHRAYQALRSLLVGHFSTSDAIAEERDGT